MATNGLPAVNAIGMDAPMSWLAGAWTDLWKAPGPFLLHGLVIAILCAAVSLALISTGMGLWAISLVSGFVFIAPMLAMGMYEGGRLIEAGRKPTLGEITFVGSAFRPDVAYLGLSLLVIFQVWGHLAQIVYGLSTNRLYRTFDDFLGFVFATPAGHGMLFWGTIIGGIMAWLTFCLVVVSAPMLLDRRTDIFIATITSVRCVVRNTLPMLLWAAIVAVLTTFAAATGFLAMIIVFPWLGLASWRAYRALTRPVALENAA